MNIARMIATGVLGGGRVTPWYLAGGVPAANCKGAYIGKGAASYEVSKINLASPGTNNLIDTAHVPDWTADGGWTGGTGKYFSTGIVPASGWSAVVWVANGSGAGYYFGERPETGDTFFGISAESYFLNGAFGGSSALIAAKTSGILAIAGPAAYFNGNKIADLPAWSGTNLLACYVLCRNKLNSENLPVAGNVYAFAIYDTILTQEQIQAVGAALNP